jgi:hypothetical protein
MVALDAANRSSDTIACQSKARSGAMTILSSMKSIDEAVEDKSEASWRHPGSTLSRGVLMLAA